MRQLVRHAGAAAALTLLAIAIAAGCQGGPAAPHPLPDPPKAKSAAPKEPQVDNGRCFVCHANYQEEPLVVAHAGGAVGCEKCHGDSKTHTNDEDNVTAPEVMYAREKINAACLMCHTSSAFVREPGPIAGAPPGPAACTDCHFKHRLARRDRVWDKNTGKLLSAPPVNPMTSPK